MDGLLQDDGNGKYYYDSAENAAYLDQSTMTFRLYEEVVATADQSSDPSYYVGNTSYKRGNFLPFNDINRTSIWAINNDEGKIGEPIYGIKPDNSRTGSGERPNYHFGIYMEGTFYQPEIGQRPTFYIRGDDDILVYIDDVLVLDMGGLHDPLEGSIYFGAEDGHEAGYVYYETAAGTTVETTLKDLLIDKGSVYNSTDERKLSDDNNDFNGDTLASGTIHTIKIFYAERGAGASNLRIEVNSPDPQLTITNSFWEDADASEITGNERFIPLAELDWNNFANARYILQELETVDDIGKVSFRLRYVETEGDNTGTRTTVAKYEDFGADSSYTFTNLNDAYTYYVEILDADDNVIAASDPIDRESDDLKQVTITLFPDAKDEHGNPKDNVTINVQYALGSQLKSIEEPKFELESPWTDNGTTVVAGDHTFYGLDFAKRYQIVQQLYYDDANGERVTADGSNNDYGYEFTSVFIDGEPQLKDPSDALSHRQTAYMVTNPFTLLEYNNNRLIFPEIVYRNVYFKILIDKNLLVDDGAGGVKRKKYETTDVDDLVTFEVMTNVPNYSNYPANKNIIYQIID